MSVGVRIVKMKLKITIVEMVSIALLGISTVFIALSVGDNCIVEPFNKISKYLLITCIVWFSIIGLTWLIIKCRKRYMSHGKHEN